MPSVPHGFPSRRQFITQLSLTALALSSRPLRAAGDEEPKKKMGIALVGLGNYATQHLAPAIKKSKYWQIAGAVTGTAGKGTKFAHEHGFPEKNVFDYASMQKLSEHPEIDFVYVVTPNGLHAEHCIAAAQAGKHVICEKPMANTVAECEAMIAACEKAGVRLSVGYRLHYDPHHAEFARFGKENTFGVFKQLKGANGFYMSESQPKPWRVNKKLAGGGPLMDMGIYVIQAACMAKAEAAPASIVAKFGPLTRPSFFSEVEESIQWTMEFADGAKADCRASYGENVSIFRAEGDKGWAQLDEPAFYYAEPKISTSNGPVNKPGVNQQLAQMDGMAKEMLAHQPTIASGEMGRRDLAIIEAIYASANQDGKRVEVKA